MKFLIAGIFMFAANSVSYAQSTCLSRCEDAFGPGDSRCPEICTGVDDRLKRKKKGNDAAAAAAFAAGAASASAAASTPKTESVAPKDSKLAPAKASASATASASTPKNESIAPKDSEPAPTNGQPGK